MILDLVRHDLGHALEMLLVLKVLGVQVVETVKLDAVTLEMGLLLLALDSVLVEVGVVVPWSRHFEQHGDALEFVRHLLCQIDHSLVLQDADDITVRRVEVVAEEELVLDSLVKLG